MEARAWASRYAAAADTAATKIALARERRELVACGLTTNVDRVAALTDELLARLLGERRLSIDGPRVTRVGSVEALLTAVAQCVAAGEGTDLPVAEPAVQAWLLERVEGRVDVGGTGAQAAVTLARLGMGALLHTTGRSAEQVGAVSGAGRVLVATDGGLRPIGEAIERGDPTMWHVVLEYQAGLLVRVDGREMIAPQANRVIVSGDPVNAALAIDPRFVAAVADPANGVRRVLISGFSQVIDPGELRRVVAETAEAIRRWRAARPEISIHLELGAMPETGMLSGVVEALGGRVDGIGCNRDELREVLAGWGIASGERPEELVAGLATMRRRVPARRVSVHAREVCLTLTDGGPEAERDALLFGSLVATTRARLGTFPTLADLAETLETGESPRVGVEALAGMGLDGGIGRCGAGWLVGVPAMPLREPAATVGLGDSFTAGVMVSGEC